VSELSVQAWDRVLAVNLRAVFLLSRLAVPDMLAAGKDHQRFVGGREAGMGQRLCLTAPPSSPSPGSRRRSAPRSGPMGFARASCIRARWRPSGVRGPPRSDVRSAQRAVPPTPCRRRPSPSSSRGSPPRRHTRTQRGDRHAAERTGLPVKSARLSAARRGAERYALALLLRGRSGSAEGVRRELRVGR
jgi:NAD(P)-dependent dehydrogenase (short-subunit alcohol dehydrogenase family)